MTTPDQMPEKPDGGEHLTSSGHPKVDGWGVPTELQNPFSATPPKSPWFRRPAALVSVLVAAVVVVAGLVTALVVITGDDHGSEAVGRTTSNSMTTSSSDVELTYTDTRFLRGISPSIRRNATDEELVNQADYICSMLESGSKSQIQSALIDTAIQMSTWKGELAPTREGSEYSMDEELAVEAMRFMMDAEEAYCPGSMPDSASDMVA